MWSCYVDSPFVDYVSITTNYNARTLFRRLRGEEEVNTLGFDFIDGVTLGMTVSNPIEKVK